MVKYFSFKCYYSKRCWFDMNDIRYIKFLFKDFLVFCIDIDDFSGKMLM